MKNTPLQAIKNAPPRGQSLVEFAISLMLLLILLAGIVDVSRALFTYLSMRDSAQEGALYASIDPTNYNEIRDRVCDASNLVGDLCAADPPANGVGFEVLIAPTVSGKLCMGATSGTAHGIQVTVHYPNFPLTMPLIGQLIGQGDYQVPITASIIDTIITPGCP